MADYPSSVQISPSTEAHAAARVAAFPGAGAISDDEARACAEVVRLANDAAAPDWRSKALAYQRLAHFHRRVALDASRQASQANSAAVSARDQIAWLNRRMSFAERAIHEALAQLAELRDSPGRSRIEWEEARNGFNRVASFARELGLDSEFIEEAA